MKKVLSKIFLPMLILNMLIIVISGCNVTGTGSIENSNVQVNSIAFDSLLDSIVHQNPGTNALQGSRVNTISNSIIIDLSINYGKLNKNDFTFSIDESRILSGITLDAYRKTIDAAVIVWSSICNVSFKRVSTGGDFVFKVEDVYSPLPAAGATAPGIGATGTITFYQYEDTGKTIMRNWDANKLYGVVIHEIGHCLGMGDMRSPYNGTIPPLLEKYDDKEYFRWRMSFVSGTYDASKDTHISIMDHDCASGRWGHSPQCTYPSAYDIAVMQYKYGTPDYLPLITFWCDKGADGVTDYRCTYTTTDWDLANSMARKFKGGSDVQSMLALIPRTFKAGSATRYLLDLSLSPPYQKGYCISKPTSNGVLDSYIKYMFTAGGTTNMTFGTQTKARPLSAIYQYKYADRAGYWVTNQNGDPALYGFSSKEIVGYAVLATELTNP